MRETVDDSLSDSATIQRHTLVSDGAGGTTETWASLAVVPCRITHAGGGESGSPADRIAEETTHVVTLAAQTDIEESDRIAVGGITYEVTLVRKRGSWELSRRVEVKETV